MLVLRRWSRSSLTTLWDKHFTLAAYSLFVGNAYNDIVVNWFVLPHPTWFVNTLRENSQLVLNP